jgi:hypothetical protein
MEEIWKEISDFKKYEISNLGNIRKKDTQQLLKPGIKSGYLSVCLINDTSERKSCKMHRLVALTFIPNIENKETVNHKDHNKLNNILTNLEWATTTEQNNHKRKCEKDRQELVSSRAIWRVDKDTDERIELYKTIKFAAQWVFDNKLTSITDFNNGNNIKTKISAVAQGKRTISYGYKWIYDDKDEMKYTDEIWKELPSTIVDGITGYKISNYGRVKNHKGRITEGHLHPASGYLWVSIAPKQYLLHRLVAKAFIPNIENKEQVNHIDGNKQNSKASNLEWCTNQENQIHKVTTGLSNWTIKIIQYDIHMNEINRFNSMKEASDKLNIAITGISMCCSNKAKTAGGFIFKLDNSTDMTKK